MFPTSPSGAQWRPVAPWAARSAVVTWVQRRSAQRFWRLDTRDMKETQGGQETKKTGRQSKSLGHENMVRPASEPSVNAPGCLTKDEDLYIERLWSASVMVAQCVCSKFFDPECVSSIPRHQDERQTGSNS